jgi:hypothetical protein
MNEEERVGFLRWIDTAANPELERELVALVSLRELLREPPTRDDADWPIREITSELQARRSLGR